MRGLWAGRDRSTTTGNVPHEMTRFLYLIIFTLCLSTVPPLLVHLHRQKAQETLS